MKKLKLKREPFWKDALILNEEEIFSDLTGIKASSLFLGKYSLPEVAAVLEKRNFFKEARKRNLWPLDYRLDSSAFPVQRLQIFLKEKAQENLIVDLKIKVGGYTPPLSLEDATSLKNTSFLVLEWLTLQNPLLGFTEKRPALPGQAHPGLNLSKKVMDIFTYLARLMHKDGLLAFPAYFHNALLFSRYFHFFNPEKQGEIMAVRKAFSTIPFKQLAWIVYFNCLKEGDQVYEWKAEEQVFPLSRRLKEYFDSKPYKDRVRLSEKERHFVVDWDGFREKTKYSQ
jgi:hypothetical protein